MGTSEVKIREDHERGQKLDATMIPVPVVAAHELALLRKEVADVRHYARGAFIVSAGAFLFGLLAALFSGFTAYVTYTVIQALRDFANQLN